MRNVTEPSGVTGVLPGEIENVRRMRSYLRAFTRVWHWQRGSAAWNSSAGMSFIGDDWYPESPSPDDTFGVFIRRLGSCGRPGQCVCEYSGVERVSDVGVRFSAGPRGARMNIQSRVSRILILRIPVYHISRVNSRCSAVLSNDTNIER